MLVSNFSEFGITASTEQNAAIPTKTQFYITRKYYVRSTGCVQFHFKPETQT